VPAKRPTARMKRRLKGRRLPRIGGHPRPEGRRFLAARQE
jgi:hypothetical protein